ncbi:MAG TPA: terpene cyclase/mutase family protein [Kiritimatiellia bacterium]|nr:terpene cyclase/mutase family protein [Kiritimatiellia bacterium]HMP34624.1 terpene cyclase/mutase family protein [Kiritimatiellia bacterium]
MNESASTPTPSTESIKKKHLRRRILEHMLGPVGSIIFHIIIVIAALKFLGMVGEQKDAAIQVQIMEPDAIDLEEFEKELEQMDELTEMTDLVNPDQNFDMETPPDVSTDVAPSEDISMDLADLNVISDAQSPLVMKGLYEGRSAAGRSKMLGGAGRWAREVEGSVNKALEWLKNNQAEDGSWGPGDREAMTGLAVLTFLANGETPSSAQYGATVEKGIKYLVSLQEKFGEGRFANWTPGGEGGMHQAYAHGIATYALSEAYGLTRIPSLKPVMENAVALIVNGQQPGGSWDYGFRKTARRDASVAGWQLQALKAAIMAGASTPGIKEALDRGVEELIKSQHPETGMFPYSSPDRGKMSITGVSVLCLQISGKGRDSATRRGLQALKQADIDWQKPMDWPMYSWYYITQAKFHAGGGDWDQWNMKFAREIIRNQNDDGSWTSAGQNIEGDGHGKEVNHGPVYATTLAALTLQVYYRFLPTYKPVEVEEDKGPSKDVVIEII